MADLSTADIPSFYAGRCILLTGATGFLGKVIMEKFLRSCPDLKALYIVVRGKGSSSPTERMEAIFKGELYERLRKEQPNFASKVIPIAGELTDENLGISAEDTETLIQNVSVVIHSAATVRFTEKIKLAVDLNVLVVRRMIELARKVKNLAAFMHISTAYAHTNRDYIEERVYDPSIEPQRLITLTDYMDPELAEAMTPHFLGERPNSYTLTKSVAEYIVATEAKDLPTLIVRPSIVSSTWKEPVPGWVDNFNGPQGVVMAYGSGLARVLPIEYSKEANVIPVDTVANYIISAAWYSSCKLYPSGITEVPVFNCAVGDHLAATWGTWNENLKRIFVKYPLETNTVRRVKVKGISPSRWKELAIRKFLFHVIPAHTIDFLLKLIGKKPMMVRLFNKMERSFAELRFFTTNEWQWEDQRSKHIMAAMTEADRQNFNLDLRSLNWSTYLENMVVGLKKYMLKESLDNIGKARRVAFRHYLVSMFLKTLFVYFFLKFVVPFLRARGMTWSRWLVVVPALYLTKKILLA